MKLVVGLGNPGAQYALTRHNVGFMVLDSLDLDFKSGFLGLYAKSDACLYLKPETYMNRSGDSVLQATHFYKLAPEDVIVIHDELDLPFGSIKLKKSGGHAGHNGLRDIIRQIGPDFTRIRFGISKPEHKSQITNYVLSAFTAEEQKQLPQLIQEAQTLLSRELD